MNKRGVDFLNNWLNENIQVDVYPEEGVTDPRVKSLVEQCVADAKDLGISRKEIEEDAGSLTDRISEALREATDNEVNRLAARDD